MTTKITPDHLARGAIVYVRQSTAGQVEDHPESRRRQYALKETARSLGFADVQTIDDDLGKSGAAYSDRPGFQRLLAAVCAGRVGAVLALEASRLARNDRDWTTVIELCAISSVVLIDHDGVYDPRAVNDRLLLGLKGIMSEFELATLQHRAYEAVRAKAARGELRIHLPVGLAYRRDGVIELDADVRVQKAVRLVFRKFDELGSLRQVLLWFHRQSVTLPVIQRSKGAEVEVRWGAATYHRIHAIISNPFYAGAYAFGRTESRTTIVDGRPARTPGHSKPMEQWEVLLQHHHRGYIDWDQFLRNRAILQENAFMKPSTGRKAARGGRSLLSGLLRCKRCGYTLEVSYRGADSGTPAFHCRRRHHARAGQRCISFSGKRVEDAVAEQILRAVEGHAVQAALAAASKTDEKRREVRQALVLELEQARYEAQLAARRHERVDPDQRLVAAELEARWNVALERVHALDSRLRELDARRPEERRVDEQGLLALAADLPAVWNAEATDMRLKQRIARLVIREVLVDVDDAANEVLLLVHWAGGRHTEIRVPKTLSGRTGRCTEAETLDLVKQMAGRFSDHAIASALNRIGSRTGAGNTWTVARLRALRSRLKLPAFDPSRPRDETVLTCREAAQRLGISAQYLGRLLERGVVPGTRVAPGAPWQIAAAALDSLQVRSALRALRERRAATPSLQSLNLTIPGT